MGMEWNALAVSLIGGIGLGVLYFGGLWLTVKRLIKSRQPFLEALLSFYLRLAVVIAGLYVLMDDRWERLLIALAGFLVVRITAFQLTRPHGTRVDVL